MGDRGDIAAGGIGAIDIGGEEARARRRATCTDPLPTSSEATAVPWRPAEGAPFAKPRCSTRPSTDGKPKSPHVLPRLRRMFQTFIPASPQSTSASRTPHRVTCGPLDASRDIRSLIGRIVLHPGAKRGEIHATLHGSLMGILDFANDNPSPDASRVITSVASGSRG